MSCKLLLVSRSVSEVLGVDADPILPESSGNNSLL